MSDQFSDSVRVLGLDDSLHVVNIGIALLPDRVKSNLMHYLSEQVTREREAFFLSLREQNPDVPFVCSWYLTWREQMLRFFAEERLPDFIYREMLVSGLRFKYLAWRKLLLPIKWLAAGLYTLTMSIEYLIAVCIRTASIASIKFIFFTDALLSPYQVNRRKNLFRSGAYFRAARHLTIEIARYALGIILLFPMWVLFLFTSLLYIFCVSGGNSAVAGITLTRIFSQVLGAPINHSIRPMKNWLQKHTHLALQTQLSKAQKILLALGFFYGLLFPNGMLWMCQLASECAIVISSSYYIYYTYFGNDPSNAGIENSPRESLFNRYKLFLLNVIVYGFFHFSILEPLALVDTPNSLFNFASNFIVSISLFNMAESEYEQQCRAQAIPKVLAAIKQTVVDKASLARSSRTFWSNQLFNTGDPEVYPVLNPDDTSIVSQVRSFFGGDLAGEKSVKPAEKLMRYSAFRSGN